ncbi:hypothetical protein ETAA8_21080 [Anatilimnocola aggregata]|uniref:Uncharacterized protein n=1 Tax=Anatilimnocola aggregata TaxID=2528021 RepID=A0A517Y9X2_9BACT|nr:hypothetical protein [Anatilimnocola aggregata]QDU27024.1 hypothetical protein ETAA8_21080 [Anatilimnocola aggregata]
MLSTLLLMTVVLMVSVGNLALGFGLAIHLGHGPAGGWQALLFWKKSHAAEGDAGGHPATEHSPAPAKAHH